MKEVVPGKEYGQLFYRYNFQLDMPTVENYLMQVQAWLDNNCKGPHGIVIMSYWHGEDQGACGGTYHVVTIQEDHEASLFKLTWM